MAKADITVRGRQYSVACAPGREDRLVELAKELDLRLAQIGEAVGEVGDQRLLLIAGLSLLDELDAARQSVADVSSPEIDRAAAALDKAADQIEALTTRIEAEL